MVENLIDIDHEQLISLAGASRYVTKRFGDRRGGRPLNVSTIHRWVGRGLKGIHLESIQVGGTRFTSAEALHRFFERLAGRDPVVVRQTSASHMRRVAEAEKVLDKAGI